MVSAISQSCNSRYILVLLRAPVWSLNSAICHRSIGALGTVPGWMSAKWMSYQRRQDGPTETSNQSRPHQKSCSSQASLSHVPLMLLFSPPTSHSPRLEVLPAPQCLLPAPKVVAHTAACRVSPSPGLSTSPPWLPPGLRTAPFLPHPHPGVCAPSHTSQGLLPQRA